MCLDSLAAIKPVGFSFEVIVVDNNSADGEIHKISRRYPQFRFILNELNGGFGYGCNKGAEKATGRFLLFLNPDTVASGTALQSMLQTMTEHPEFTILSCRQVNDKGREAASGGEFPSLRNLTGVLRAVVKVKKPQLLGNITFVDWVSGSVVMISAENFKKVSGFDEDFWMYYEDVDLCKRVRNAGGKVACHRKITIEHNHGGSSRVNVKTSSLTKAEVIISRHVYFSKHYHGLTGSLIQSFMVINNLITNLLTAITGLILFFVPKVFVRYLVFNRLIGYYAGALWRRSWISPKVVSEIIPRRGGQTRS